MKNRRKRLPAACIAVLAVTPLHVHAVRVSYSADVGVERDDNVLMSPTDEITSTALRTGLGIVVTEDTSTVQANVGGRFDYWNYVDGPQSNALEGTLAGRLDWFFVPETMSFTVEDSLEMRPVDRFAPDTVENRQRVNVLSLGPNIHFNWNQAAEGRFEVRWTDTSAEITEEYESDRLSGALHLLRELDATSSVSLTARAQDVDFDDDEVARDYRRYDAYMRFQKELSRTGFSVDLGHSWVDYADGDSASHPLVRGEVHWQATDRSFLSLGATYQLSDTAEDALAGIGETVTVPDDLSGASGALESSIYEDNRAELSYTYSGERFAVAVGPYYERIDYVDDTTPDETRRGGIAEVSYRISETWEMQAFVDVAKSTFPDLGTHTTDTRMGLGIDKTLSRHWSASARYTYYERKDDGLFGDSDQNVLYLTVTYRNR